MNESMDRVLADWLREGPEMGPREGLERTLAATRRIGQRPGWTFPERWLPMQLTLTRTPSLRPLLVLATVALVILALVAVALFVGSSRRLPEPFGPARNGALVYEHGGDLMIADSFDGTGRTLLGGPDSDSFPVFSNQGDRIAFVRGDGGGFDLMSVRPDGSDLRMLGTFPGGNVGLTWSPNGERLLMNYSRTGPSGFRLAIVNADGSGSRELDVGRPADYASWRPDGRHIVFRGQLDDGMAGAFIANADGTGVRQLPIPSMGQVDFEGLGWSPDGAHLSFMSDGRLGGTSGWQINVADIDANGNLTELHQLKMDPESTDEYLPAWSPDSSQFAFLLGKDSRRHVAIARADGSGMRLVGPETSTVNILGYTWSPDGASLLITEFPDNEAQREAKRRAWSVDVATGEQRETQTFVRTWQRLAP